MSPYDDNLADQEIFVKSMDYEDFFKEPLHSQQRLMDRQLDQLRNLEEIFENTVQMSPNSEKKINLKIRIPTKEEKVQMVAQNFFANMSKKQVPKSPNQTNWQNQEDNNIKKNKKQIAKILDSLNYDFDENSCGYRVTNIQSLNLNRRKQILML